MKHAWTGPACAGLFTLVLAACGGSSATSSSAPMTISQPTTLNLYPNQSSNNAGRLTIMATAIGSLPVNLPVKFDTGSAGVTLYAPSVFPSSMVTNSGFIFPAGESSMTYNGITVTTTQGTREYGSTSEVKYNGNVGYATLTLGDSQGTLTTQVMPIFFYYSYTDAADNTIEAAAGDEAGWLGVASTYGTVVVDGVTDPAGGLQVCSQQTQGSCEVVSALKYLSYGSSVNAGFVLAPATLQSCDITVAGSCSPAPILTVGLTSALESGFSTTALTCPPSGNIGEVGIAGYPVCGKNISGVSIAASGASVGSITNTALFDSGTRDMEIAPPAGSTFPSTVVVGSTVLVTTPSGFTYSFTAGTGNLTTVVNENSGSISIIGVGYFTSHSFFVDFSSSIEGWK